MDVLMIIQGLIMSGACGMCLAAGFLHKCSIKDLTVIVLILGFMFGLARMMVGFGIV